MNNSDLGSLLELSKNTVIVNLKSCFTNNEILHLAKELYWLRISDGDRGVVLKLVILDSNSDLKLFQSLEPFLNAF